MDFHFDCSCHYYDQVTNSIFYRLNLPAFFDKSCFDSLLQGSSHIQVDDIIDLYYIIDDWCKRTPLMGKRILYNCHLTSICLYVLLALKIAGAKVDVISTKQLVVHDDKMKGKNVLTYIIKSGFNYYSHGQIPIAKQQSYYDIIVDCGAGLNHLEPKLGVIELTKVPKSYYLNAKVPVINVNDSKTKTLETRFGTSDGFIRVILHEYYQGLKALYSIIQRPSQLEAVSKLYHLVSLLSTNNPFSDGQHYVIFGYGKVGQGLAGALRTIGIKKNNILIIDCVKKVVDKIVDDDFNAMLLDPFDDDYQSKLVDLRNHLKNTFCVGSATGRVGSIAELGLLPCDFKDVKLLLNMSTENDFGEDFAVYADGIPANFVLDYPTRPCYLSPIFALKLLCIEYLCDHYLTLSRGLQNPPISIDENVLQFWQNNQFKPNSNLISLYRDKMNQINKLRQLLISFIGDNNLLKLKQCPDYCNNFIKKLISFKDGLKHLNLIHNDSCYGKSLWVFSKFIGKIAIVIRKRVWMLQEHDWEKQFISSSLYRYTVHISYLSALK